MGTAPFSKGKRAIFPKVKEIRRLRGGVAVYAAQASVRIDAAIGEKGRFRMKTSSEVGRRKCQEKLSNEPNIIRNTEGSERSIQP
jgi:hypothetical protein